MKYSIVYSSDKGNTKLLADTIKASLNEKDQIYFGPCNDADVYGSDVIFVGFWTDQGTCDKLTKEFLNSLKDTKVFLFGSAGFGKDPNYFVKILDRTKAELDDSVEVVGSFMCQGKMHMSVRERYLKMKETNPNMPNIDMLIENFDEALSHPDSNDLNNLKAEINKL